MISKYPILFHCIHHCLFGLLLNKLLQVGADVSISIKNGFSPLVLTCNTGPCTCAEHCACAGLSAKAQVDVDVSCFGRDYLTIKKMISLFFVFIYLFNVSVNLRFSRVTSFFLHYQMLIVYIS